MASWKRKMRVTSFRVYAQIDASVRAWLLFSRQTRHSFHIWSRCVTLRSRACTHQVSADTARQVLEVLLEKSVTMKVLIDTRIGMTVKSTR